MLKHCHGHILDKELVPYIFLMFVAREMKLPFLTVHTQQAFIVDIMKMPVLYVKNLSVLKVKYVWWEVPMKLKDVSKYASMVFGEPSVIIHGMYLMQELFVINWDTPQEVFVPCTTDYNLYC